MQERCGTLTVALFTCGRGGRGGGGGGGAERPCSPERQGRGPRAQRCPAAVSAAQRQGCARPACQWAHWQTCCTPGCTPGSGAASASLHPLAARRASGRWRARHARASRNARMLTWRGSHPSTPPQAAHPPAGSRATTEPGRALSSTPMLTWRTQRHHILKKVVLKKACMPRAAAHPEGHAHADPALPARPRRPSVARRKEGRKRMKPEAPGAP